MDLFLLEFALKVQGSVFCSSVEIIPRRASTPDALTFGVSSFKWSSLIPKPPKVGKIMVQYL